MFFYKCEGKKLEISHSRTYWLIARNGTITIEERMHEIGVSQSNVDRILFLCYNAIISFINH